LGIFSAIFSAILISFLEFLLFAQPLYCFLFHKNFAGMTFRKFNLKDVP
jgi:hypothetical protein